MTSHMYVWRVATADENTIVTISSLPSHFSFIYLFIIGLVLAIDGYALTNIIMILQKLSYDHTECMIEIRSWATKNSASI
uniref:Uncharacterized protein n=1 Tax=Pararge aegeria TaxID=116150 RepID=S4NUT5_9NEOP